MLQAPIAATGTTFAALINDFAAYNVWASQTTINWLRTKPVDLLDTEMASSYRSIKATLNHMAATEAWWLMCLRNEKPAFEVADPYAGTVEDALNGQLAAAVLFQDYVRGLYEEDLQKTCEVGIPFTGDFNIPRYEMVQQCVVHSTYHRGQIVAIGRQLGFTDAPMTDFMYYALLGRK